MTLGVRAGLGGQNGAETADGGRGVVRERAKRGQRGRLARARAREERGRLRGRLAREQTRERRGSGEERSGVQSRCEQNGRTAVLWTGVGGAAPRCVQGRGRDAAGRAEASAAGRRSRIRLGRGCARGDDGGADGAALRSRTGRAEDAVRKAEKRWGRGRKRKRRATRQRGEGTGGKIGQRGERRQKDEERRRIRPGGRGGECGREGPRASERARSFAFVRARGAASDLGRTPAIVPPAPVLNLTPAHLTLPAGGAIDAAPRSSPASSRSRGRSPRRRGASILRWPR